MTSTLVSLRIQSSWFIRRTILCLIIADIYSTYIT